MVFFHPLLFLPERAQDLANQVAYSIPYRNAIRKAGRKPGRFLSVPAAEHLSGGDTEVFFNGQVCGLLQGLPAGWSSQRVNIDAGNAKKIEKIFCGEVSHCFSMMFVLDSESFLLFAQGPGNRIPAVSFFSGIGALDLGIAMPEAKSWCQFSHRQ